MAQPLRRPFIRLALVLALTAAVMTASFAQSAAQIGLVLPVFSSWSPSFYVWRASHGRLERALIAQPDAGRAEAATRSATRVIVAEPLASAAWRTIGLAAAAQGNMAEARTMMVAVDRTGRRDPAVQAWLIDDGIRRQQIAATLTHFDALLRTESEARAPLLARLAAVLQNAAARRDLATYVRADNPWFQEFNDTAANRRGSIVPYAQLLLSARRIPDAPAYRNSYRLTVSRLVREGQFDLLRRLYPGLPGSDTSALASVSLGDGDNPAYPPVGWVLADEPDRGASLVASADGGNAAALEAFADPVISGIVANRLIWPEPGARTLRWRIVEREGARDASAQLRVRCLDAVVQSGDLFARGTAAAMTLPAACPVAMIELTMFGGTGRDPATLVLDRLAFDRRAAQLGGDER